MSFGDGLLETKTLILLAICLPIALGVEVVNGFDDTANAVATKITRRTLARPPAKSTSKGRPARGEMPEEKRRTRGARSSSANGDARRTNREISRHGPRSI